MAAEQIQTKDQGAVKLEGGTYEIIRNRMFSHGKELRSRLEKLNVSRKEIFGAIEPTLLATERISTHNNCIPRDMVPVGENRFIFGYNVQMGLKSEIKISDVFAVYEYKDREFREIPLDILYSGQFETDFKNLYKYYKDTTFAKFSTIGPHLFMIFRAGKTAKDIKTFKWAIEDNKITYIDNRSDHEFKYPAQHEFVWIRTNRDQYRYGKHPHISIEDRIFVEAVGGDITFKVEDNTATGQGIYAEPVDYPDQTLDDAEIYYVISGHIVLVKIKPYQEEKFRHFIFNSKTEQVHRVDAIADACVLLPDDQGLIFPNGYYLQTGEIKQFESNMTGMMFERRIDSANGEDFLYVFYNPESGDYILLAYNLIDQKVDTPILCNGFTYFSNGEMIYFRSEKQATKHHVVQIWQTPYISGEHAFSETKDAFLYKIGNPNIVRCMAECNELLKLLNKDDTYAGLYYDLVKKSIDIADAYFWIDKKDAFNIKEVILLIKEAASGAIDEFEKVIRIRKNTVNEVKRVSNRARDILKGVDPALMDNIDAFVSSLSGLRSVRGEIISLKDLRYVELESVEALENEVTKAADRLSGQCVEFLLKPESLYPYENRVKELGAGIDALTKVTDAKAVEEKADAASQELEMLIEIVSNLKIEDATATTRIIDNISDIYSRLNSVRAGLKNKKKSLQSLEGAAQFSAQLKLLNQSVINYLDICDTPQKCDEYLTKIMIQLEELEGKFSDFDEFIIQLSEKRDEIYNAFETRKLGLVEARNRRASVLAGSANRILKGIQNRVSGMKDVNAINGYFASDMMIEKVREIVKELNALDDTVKADEIQGRLKTIREDSVRQLKDRQELFTEGANVIRFGEYKFSVNVQPLDLTIVRRNGDQAFHLTGTNFFEKIDNPDFITTKPVWDMDVVSENRAVYRAEYLAFKMLKETEKSELDAMQTLSDQDMLARVQQFMGSRYAEGYSKGIHDVDGAKIFKALLNIHTSIGLLRFHPRSRALARLFWIMNSQLSPQTPDPPSPPKGGMRGVGVQGVEFFNLISKLQSVGVMNTLFPSIEEQEHYIAEITGLITSFVEKFPLFPKSGLPAAARYFFYELIDDENFVISMEGFELATEFIKHLRGKRFLEKFEESRKKIHNMPEDEFELIRDWITAYYSRQLSVFSGHSKEYLSDYIDEAAILVFCDIHDHEPEMRHNVLDVSMTAQIAGMVGDHPVITDGAYVLNYLRFMEKLNAFEADVVPLFNRYYNMKKELTDRMREDMRLDEFKPRVLTSFVRNQLINTVYLPLIGDNLSKQIGVVGETKRTDLMGLLLLISPPGYGKTTIMEYIANRLGIIFMKINGPAIGNRVTSLDPAEAPNASAREEVEKLNLSLEMGDNVMIYLDDIQHCNPELLQKFISLCDAQRKIEGVYKGKTRTYDLRGKKVVVVMAGNPYTESGEKFKIPDMLANRADTYNLGDIIGGTAEAFKMSFLENSLTSNSALNRLSSRSQKDIYGIIRIAEQGSREGVEFEGNYSAEEINEMVSVMQKLISVRDVILRVNQEYIYSASQADEYRTEPPFKLQGSYRNMNRIAGKIVPVMNEEELKTLILSHYENESQTLTTGAEANLLKFKDMIGWSTDKEKQRWEEIKKTFRKNQMFRGTDSGDPINRVIAQLSAFQDGLVSIKEAIGQAIQHVKNNKKTDAVSHIAFDEETLSKLECLLREIVRQKDVSVASPKMDDIWIEERPRGVFAAPIVPTTMRTIHKMPKNHFYNVIKKGDVEAVKDILNSGVSPNFRASQGATPLMAATVHNRIEIAKFLLKSGADVNAVDDNGYTSLMIAACKGYIDMVNLLLAHGADRNIKDKDGLTPLTWAEKAGNKALVDVLDIGA